MYSLKKVCMSTWEPWALQTSVAMLFVIGVWILLHQLDLWRGWRWRSTTWAVSHIWMMEPNKDGGGQGSAELLCLGILSVNTTHLIGSSEQTWVHWRKTTGSVMFGILLGTTHLSLPLADLNLYFSCCSKP